MYRIFSIKQRQASNNFPSKLDLLPPFAVSSHNFGLSFADPETSFLCKQCKMFGLGLHMLQIMG